MVVSDVTKENIDAVHAFLEQHSDTTLFLSSNLSTYGPTIGEALNSGNFKCVLSNGVMCGVFSLTRRGNLLVETGGRTDFATAILEACAGERIPIQGVIGEWRTADALWQRLFGSGNIVERYASRELLQRLDLPQVMAPRTGVRNVRRLKPDDFDQWEPVNRAYLLEEGLPVQGTPEQRRANFDEQARAGYWWGCPNDGPLLATAALNAVHCGIAQVGGVYTTPDSRRRGLARAVMRALIEDAVSLHRLKRLVLFTGEKNQAARALYESLGFSQVGEFGLFFGGIRDCDA